MALLVAVVVGLLKEAGAAAALAIGAVSVVGYLLVRRLRWHSRSALDCPGNGKLGTDPDRTVFRILRGPVRVIGLASIKQPFTLALAR